MYFYAEEGIWVHISATWTQWTTTVCKTLAVFDLPNMDYSDS